MNHSLIYITQSQEHNKLKEELKQILDYGIQCVQLRIKNTTNLPYLKYIDYYKKCGEISIRIVEKYDCTFIINDSVDICTHLNADGVHLGKKDMELKEARNILKNKIIGATANKWEDIENAKNIANYIGLGPLRQTKTKKNLSPILGFDAYHKIIQKKPKTPIYAIGGIELKDCEKLNKLGLNGVAISSFIYNKGSEKTVENIHKIFNLNKKSRYEISQ